MKIKDHSKLKMSFQELGAFLATYTMLKLGVLKIQKPSAVTGDVEPPKAGEHTFNMATAGMMKECGTVGCIGGNMAIFMGQDPMSYIKSATGEKKKLFYPPDRYAYSKIPVKLTLKAMENFARTGKADWAKVLGDKYLDKNWS